MSSDRWGIILMGLPGVGKGTQAHRLRDKLRVPHISTGDMLREAVQEKTLVGLKAKKFMDAGELVPDEIIVRLIADRLAKADAQKGYILDGFPRTLEQANRLEEVLIHIKFPLSHVLQLDAPDSVVLERISGRRNADGLLRADDNQETAIKRIEVYRKRTAPIVHYYQEKGLLRVIPGDRSVEEVFQSLVEALA